MKLVLLLCGFALAAPVRAAKMTKIPIAAPDKVAADLLETMDDRDTRRVILLLVRRNEDARRVVRKAMRRLRLDERGYLRFGRKKVRSNVDACKRALGPFDLSQAPDATTLDAAIAEIHGELSPRSVVFLDGLSKATFDGRRLTGSDVRRVAAGVTGHFDPAGEVQVVIALKTSLFNLSFAKGIDRDVTVFAVPTLTR